VEIRLNLDGKIALITGTRRLGAAVAVALATDGTDLALTYRESRREAEAAARTASEMDRRTLVIKVDVGSPPEVEAAVRQVTEKLGGVDILVNVASIYEKVPFDQSDAGDWDRNMIANARGAFLCARAVIPVMRGRGGGRIINFTDWTPASRRPRYKGFASYYTSKATVIAMTEALALETARDGILVNAIAPGPILPHHGITGAENDEVLRNTPLGRWGGEEAIVQAVRALLLCDFVTGEVLRVDGGRHLR
jgi:NAD(P)-dependent dehydrogenase (short-subunit alcohol dehydrogenase family)